MYRSQAVPTTEELKKLVLAHKTTAARFTRLQKYYEGKHDILDRTMTDTTKPNNKIVNNYPGYITDMLTGYFLGSPISYASEDQKLLGAVTPILEYNDEQDHNIELAKLASIHGRSFELLYQDEDGNTRFTALSPAGAFVVRGTTLAADIIAGVRFYDVAKGEKTVTVVEMYEADQVTTYELDGESMVANEISGHVFGDVPFVEYVNNTECLGDFEKVLSLVDAYDKAQSDTLNDMDQFTDAYLVLKNMAGTEEADVTAMKEKRVLLVEAEGSADWLIKQVNDTWVENFKNRIKTDIHKFSMTPDMTDENFVGNASGVAISYKILGMEQLRKAKERKFKRGLQRRFELITNILAIKGSAFDWRKLDMQFSNTLPQNEAELADMIVKLEPFVSKETLISWLPRIQNALEELKKRQKELDDETPDDFDDGNDEEAAAKAKAAAEKAKKVTADDQQ